MIRKVILVRDADDGVIVANYESSVKTPHDGVVELYRHDEYYHSLKDALRDMYGIVEEDKT